MVIGKAVLKKIINNIICILSTYGSIRASMFLAEANQTTFNMFYFKKNYVVKHVVSPIQFGHTQTMLVTT